MLEGDAPSNNSGALAQISSTSSRHRSAIRTSAFSWTVNRGLPACSDFWHRPSLCVRGRSLGQHEQYQWSPTASRQRELKKACNRYEKQQFQLIFYNDTPRRYVEPGSQMQLLLGEKSSIAAAERYIDSLAAFGGTEHMAALKMALRMGPDVIFC